jgi:hypothetical protein
LVVFVSLVLVLLLVLETMPIEGEGEEGNDCSSRPLLPEAVPDEA